MVFKILKPWFRLLKYSSLYYNACRSTKKKPKFTDNFQLSYAFIIGCGRSGTTLLGDILSAHHNTAYLYEPYYLWSAIDPTLDVLNLFQNITPSLFLGSDFYLENHTTSFTNYIRHYINNNHAQLLIEKTPLNTFRIAWLRQLVPDAKFIHIVRDGLDVCNSIAKLATTNSYKIACKPNLNQWWGNNNSKWKALYGGGVALGHFHQHEVDLLDTQLSKAAYEWLLSLIEVDQWRGTLGDSLFEVTYDDLLKEPFKTLKQISEFLSLDTTPSWLDQSCTKIKSPNNQGNLSFELPPYMCEVFNQYQEKYGFPCQTKSM